MCKKTGCKNYNSTWACPPAVGTVEECKRRCEQYEHFLLFSGKFDIAAASDYDGMIRSLFDFKKIVERYDRMIGPFLDSYQLLSNEGCGRCKDCTWPDAPCRFPDHLYHSLEGYGFLVRDLAESAGMHYHNGDLTVTFFGGVLFHG